MFTEYSDRLIEYLLNRRDYVQGSELATAFDVSTKTISRVVKQINASCEDTPVIESKRGSGYCLNAQNYHRYKRHRITGTADISRLSSVERRDDILEHLLMTAPKKFCFTDLWSKYYVSDSSVSMDLKSLRSMLKAFHLTLKRSSGCVWWKVQKPTLERQLPIYSPVTMSW